MVLGCYLGIMENKMETTTLSGYIIFGEFLKIADSFWAPCNRTVVFGGLYWGPPTSGNYHLEFQGCEVCRGEEVKDLQDCSFAEFRARCLYLNFTFGCGKSYDVDIAQSNSSTS